MNFLRASASLLFASSLGQVSSTSASSSAGRKLMNFNYEEIESETSLSTTPTTQPVIFTATFTNLWSEDRHPFRFPNNAHWSPMVFTSHSDAYSMWCNGCTATRGIETIAETGGTTNLRNEISAKQDEKIVLDQKTAPGLGTPVNFGDETSPSESLCVDKDHPFASSISMIAPSPDWFSGLYNLSLLTKHPNGNDVWYQKFTANVYAWDAGTEEGGSYSLGNPQTSPKEGMRPFMAGNTIEKVFVSENSNGGLRVLPVGIITFELQGSTQECRAMSNASTINPTPADTTDAFIVRWRGQLLTTTCEKWLSGRPKKRCNKKTRHFHGKVNGSRVSDLCPMTCMPEDI